MRPTGEVEWEEAVAQRPGKVAWLLGNCARLKIAKTLLGICVWHAENRKDSAWHMRVACCLAGGPSR